MDTAATILIVEDERRLGDLFAAWLDPDFDVQIAYDGETALEEFEDGIDMVLLDRRMPGLSGDEVLEELRERGYDLPVAMVTAVEPDFDIVEMGFDDYLTKPVEREELLSMVEDLVSLQSYEESLQQYFQLASKKATLEASKSEPELEASEEYGELLNQYERAKRRADSKIESMADTVSFDDLE